MLKLRSRVLRLWDGVSTVLIKEKIKVNAYKSLNAVEVLTHNKLLKVPWMRQLIEGLRHSMAILLLLRPTLNDYIFPPVSVMAFLCLPHLALRLWHWLDSFLHFGHRLFTRQLPGGGGQRLRRNSLRYGCPGTRHWLLMRSTLHFVL